MATAAIYQRGWQHDRREIRSVALTVKHPMSQARLYWERNPQGETVFEVLSDRTFRYDYRVTYAAAEDRVTGCNCLSGRRGGRCYHQGVVRERIQRGKIGMYGYGW